VRYVYSRGGGRIFKIVVFYLLRYDPAGSARSSRPLRLEVAEARWLPLAEWRRLSYRASGTSPASGRMLGV